MWSVLLFSHIDVEADEVRSELKWPRTRVYIYVFKYDIINHVGDYKKIKIKINEKLRKENDENTH